MEGFLINLIIVFLICDCGHYINCQQMLDGSSDAPRSNNLLKDTYGNRDYDQHCGPDPITTQSYVKKNCKVEQIFDKYDVCFICNQTTVCFALRDQIPSILLNISSYNDNVTSLEIVVNYKWSKQYIIDLTNIKHLLKLRKFALTPMRGLENYFSKTYLHFNVNTFENLTDLKTLQINIPISDCSYDEVSPDCVGINFMIKPLLSLEILDLSKTMYLSADTIANITAILSNKTRQLCLVAFQTVASSLYQNTLNIKRLFSYREFKDLTCLYLSENDITVFEPGLYTIAPNLLVFSLSGNILLAGENSPLIIESLLHPNLVQLNMNYQGYISITGSLPRNGVSNIITETDYSLNIKEDSSSYKTENSPSHKQTQDSRPTTTELFSRFVHCVNNHTRQGAKSNSSRLFNGSISEQQQIMASVLTCIYPMAFTGIGWELIPPLREMYDVSCTGFIKFPVGKALKCLHFSHIHWEVSGAVDAILSGKVCFGPNSITMITLNDNAAWMQVVAYISSVTLLTGLGKLDSFSFDRNNVDVNLTMFKSVPNIKYLSLVGNNITSYFGFKLCSYLKNLTELDLANSVYNVSALSTLLADCKSLTNLSLAYNRLNSTIFSQLNLTGSNSLKQLNFSHNSMSTIDFKAIEDRHKRSNNISKLYLDVYWNEFYCRCNETNLIDGFGNVNNYTFNIEFLNFADYRCFSPVGDVAIADVIHSKNRYFSTCPDQILKKVYSALAGVMCLICVIICIVLMYRYRWNIRYKQHKLIGFCKRKRANNELERKNWKYDAFVSYCADDRFWVHDVLMKTLENVYSFRLCLHYRDFLPGEYIVDEIMNNMHHNSRDIIIVITDRFFQSEWCTFELQQAILRSHNNGNRNIIFLKIGEINNRGSADAMMVLDTYNYIEWVDDNRGKDLFWARLISALYGKNYVGRNECCLCGCFKSSEYQELP